MTDLSSVGMTYQQLYRIINSKQNFYIESFVYWMYKEPFQFNKLLFSKTRFHSIFLNPWLTGLFSGVWSIANNYNAPQILGEKYMLVTSIVINLLSFLMIMYWIYHQEMQLMECYVLNILVPVYLNESVRFNNVRVVQSTLLLTTNQIL